MRKFLIWASVVGGSTILAACNPPLQQQAAVPCNCHGSVTVQNPGDETPRFAPPESNSAASEENSAPRYHVARYSRRHYRHQGSTGYSNAGYSSVRSYDDERAVVRSASSYSYRSRSRVYSTGGGSYGASYGYESGGYAGGGAYGASDGFVPVPSGWQDGYGRMHHGARLTRGEFRRRMDPWHGYDVDCPDPR